MLPSQYPNQDEDPVVPSSMPHGTQECGSSESNFLVSSDELDGESLKLVDLADQMKELISAQDSICQELKSVRKLIRKQQTASQKSVKRESHLKKKLEEATTSESYRIGHFIVCVLKSPVTLLKLARRASETVTPGQDSSSLEKIVKPVSNSQKEHLNRVLLIVLIDVSDQECDIAIREILDLKLMLGGFDPVFITDSNALTRLVQAGVQWERLVGRASWAVAGSDLRWEEYISNELQRIRAVYGQASIFFHPLSKITLSSGMVNFLFQMESAELSTTGDSASFVGQSIDALNLRDSLESLKRVVR